MWDCVWGFGSIKDILDVVIVPIAIAIFALLFPRWWQNKHKELEIKTGLVSEISEHVMTTLATIDVLYTWAEQEQKIYPLNWQEELDETYKKWVVQSCIINSKIHAYFPDVMMSDKLLLHETWGDFSKKLSKDYIKYSEYRDGKMVNDSKSWKKERKIAGEGKAQIIKKILDTRIKLDFT